MTMSSLLLFLFISINLPSLGAEYALFTRCRSNSLSCGSIKNLKYPFWGDYKAAYCGLPAFQLTCEENITKINIRGDNYRVLDVERTSQILTVVREDYYDTICPSDYKNNTLDSTIFQYVEGLAYVTFLYNCSSDTSFPPNTSSRICFQDSSDGNDRYLVYYVLGEVYNGDCRSVIMPIHAAQAQAVLKGQIYGVIDKGFGLKWTANEEQCDACTASGGVCGYDKQFLCFCKDGSHDTSCSTESTNKPHRLLKTAIGISAGAGGGGVILISMWVIYCSKKPLTIIKRKIFKERGACRDDNIQSFMENYGFLKPKQYSYSQVKKMTKSFSSKLGEGGYGVVYKASMPDGRTVAVKEIRKSKGTGEEFINEVASISKTSHVNIVTLLGFCYEKNKRVLIYEYLPNGSLDNFIYKNGSPNAFCALEWKVLFKVAIGIARGLEYLHRGCNTRILHLDIKPQNILLDEDFCPKISDFGLAKICQKKESIVSILGTRGTVGFIAPEIFSRAFGGVSHKADVYSYGMLVLEMIGGRKNYNSGGSNTEEIYFPDWIYKDLEQGNHPASYFTTTDEENEVVRKMTLVSLWCIQMNPTNRPTISKVVEMLEAPLQSLSIPPKPSLNAPTRSSLTSSNGSSDEITQTNSISS